MSVYRCDLHVHSCLSPCGDDDMTPGNIVGMAYLNGLDIVALTDHNSSKNCPSFFKHAEAYGIIPVAGMELTTNEDVHGVCLFRNLTSAMDFGELVDKRRFKIMNEAKIFGNQLLVDENDLVCGEEEFLLINSSGLSLDEAYYEVFRRGGVFYPAHIDRMSNGIIAMLGDFPPEPEFTAFELNDGSSLADCVKKYPVLKERKLVHTVSSDAHRLADISERGFEISLPCSRDSADRARNCLIDFLLKG